MVSCQSANSSTMRCSDMKKELTKEAFLMDTSSVGTRGGFASVLR